MWRTRERERYLTRTQVKYMQMTRRNVVILADEFAFQIIAVIAGAELLTTD